MNTNDVSVSLNGDTDAVMHLDDEEEEETVSTIIVVWVNKPQHQITCLCGSYQTGYTNTENGCWLEFSDLDSRMLCLCGNNKCTGQLQGNTLT